MLLKITLKKSMIGRNQNQRRTLSALGLRKLHRSVIHKDTPSIRGMIDRVSFMVDVAEVSERKPKKSET